MFACRKIPAALCAAMGVLAAAPAAAEVIHVYTPPVTTYVYTDPATTTTATTTYYSEPVTTTYYSEPVTTYYYAEPVTTVYSEPPIVVTAPPLTTDERITSDVVDVLANDSRLSGRIAVDTRDRTVELNGVVTTPGQARIAARDAQGVGGVQEVRNNLVTRVGGSRY